MSRFFEEDSGYSLVEVMVAILILAVAIIPMVSMFDAGLTAAVRGSNYDKARAVAGEELEEIKALPFRIDPNPPKDSVVEFFPPANGPSPPVGGSTPCSPPVPVGFSCTVTTRYLDPNTLALDGTARTMMSVEVTVTWSNGSYTTTGLTSKETR